MIRSTIFTQIALAALIGFATMIVFPLVAPLYGIINATLYVSMAVFALSLALLWGFAGILCFGQSAFFGLGAYAYAIAAINLGDTTIACAFAILIPVLFAAALIAKIAVAFFCKSLRLVRIFSLSKKRVLKNASRVCFLV